MPTQIRIVWDRVRLVFDPLKEALRENRFPYNIAILPQDLLPKPVRENKLLHAQFLFYACHFMRGAINSEMAFRQLATLWHHEPWMFVPHEVMGRSVEEVKSHLARAIDYHLDEISGYWVKNSTVLHHSWSGDPRKIFKGIQSREEAVARIASSANLRRTKKAGVYDDLAGPLPGFHGFQDKMVSMIAYFLMEAKLIETISNIPPAVDFHLLRVMFANGILTCDNLEHEKNIRYDTAFPRGLEVVMQYMEDTNTSAVELGDMLWCLSQAACRRAPGNRAIRTKIPKFRPTTGRHDVRVSTRRPKIIGADGRKVLPEFAPIDLESTVQIEAYERSCLHCPARATCMFHVQSGSYYEGGFFRFRTHVCFTPRLLLFTALPHQAAPPKQIGGVLRTPQRIEQLSLLPREPDASS